MKIEELKKKSSDELKTNVLTLKKELFNLRFQKSSGQLENTARFSHIRREIAQCLTLLHKMKSSSTKKAGE